MVKRTSSLSLCVRRICGLYFLSRFFIRTHAEIASLLFKRLNISRSYSERNIREKEKMRDRERERNKGGKEYTYACIYMCMCVVLILVSFAQRVHRLTKASVRE